MRMQKHSSLKKLAADKNGNVLMIMALSMVPVVAVIGSGIDYGRAARSQQELNAAADAAALMGVSATEVANATTNNTVNLTTIKADVTRMFLAQASSVQSVSTSFDSTGATNPLVSVSQPNAANPLAINVSITYTATSTNLFMGVIGNTAVDIGSTSAATTANAPNIDFYVMMDTSPSMLFPIDDTGVTTMTTQTGGCAYACHQSSAPTSDNTTTYLNGTYDAFGHQQSSTTDFYGFARNKGVILRFDAEQSAVSSLMSTAYTAGVNNRTKYRMVIDTFDVAQSNLQPIIAITDGTASPSATGKTTAAAAAKTASLYVPYKNNYDANKNNNNDQDTHFEDMMTALNTNSSSGYNYYIPNSGLGSNAPSDTPEKYLFLITDGFDENSRFNNPGFGPLDVTKCTALKNRGIRIAILYLQIDQNSFSDSWSKSTALPQVTPAETALSKCATPGLLYTVAKGQDITNALNNLFLQAISQPVLTQ